jgi:hypothetical protein
VIAHEHIDLLIPTTDAEVRRVHPGRASGFPGRLFLPRRAVVDLCQDKYSAATVAGFARAGVPVPPDLFP